MKKIILKLISILLLIIICNKMMLSQIGDNYFKIYDIKKEFFDSVALAENKEVWEIDGYLEFQRWADFFKTRNGENGSIGQYVNALQDYYDFGDNINEGDNLSEWSYIGHHKPLQRPNGYYDGSSGQGWINSLWVNPDDIDHILAGAHNGGIWKTYDGGDIWKNITDEYDELKGIKSIYVLPDNIDKIYVVTTTLDQYSNGLFYSEDGGETWTQNKLSVTGNDYYPTASKDKLPNKWIVNPDNNQEMWLITYTQVLRSINGGNSWSIIINRWPDYQNGEYSIWNNSIGFRDLEFDPDDNSIVYASGYEAFRIYNQGNNYDNLTTLLLDDYGCPTDGAKRIYMGTHENYHNKIWFSIYTKPVFGTTTTLGILEYYDTQANEVVPLVTDDKIKDDWKMQCEVSPINPDHIVLGGITTKLYDASQDPSVNYISILGPSNDPSWVHADIRDVCFVTDINNREIIFSANDGSVSRGIYDIPSEILWNWDFIGNDGSDGIINGESHGFDCSDSEDNTIYTGFQDMNSAIYNNGNWYIVLTGDGSSGLIDKTDPNYIYAAAFGPGAIMHRSINNGNSFEYIYFITDNNIPPLCLHPNNPNLMYAGGFKKLFLFEDVRTSYYYDPYPPPLIIKTIDDDVLPGYEYYGSLNIREIAISESNPDIIFFSTERYFPEWCQNNLFAKALFRSTDGGASFTDLSFEQKPGLNEALSRGSITGIVINPFDEQEIWICFGGITTEANPADIIITSKDGGNNWQPLSQQPNKVFPGNDLQYDKNTGILYFANDIGIYIYTSNNEWQLINNNLAPNIVNFVRFNHALNKVRVATYGRGIWQTDIPSCMYRSTPLTICEDITWSTIKFMHSDVIVEPNCTLTVTDKVYIPENAKFVIKRGAKLILDGGTLTNACDGLWQGIEVWGTASATQNPIDQGWVQVINGGTIENAVCGIRAVKMSIPQDGEEAPDYMYTGGIIQANDAHFINNQTAVQFYNYAHSSVSYFINSEFKVDENYIGTIAPENFMVIDNMTGIHVTLCDFLNEKTETANYTGILSQNSAIYVEGDCISGLPCNGTFENLNYGIYSTAATPSRHIDIRYTGFIDNYRGVYVGSMTSPRITSNKFYLNRPASEKGYGLYLDRSTGYWVEDNIFEKSPNIPDAHPKGIGIIVNESGRNPNQIYLNVFNHVENAINVQGKNRHGKIETQGLVIKCNDFNETAFDETIIWDSPIGSSEAGIARKQGLGTLNIADMAGNLFYVPSPIPDGDFDDINNSSNRVDYYYSTNANTIYVEPIDAQFNVTVWKYGMPTNDEWSLEDACLSNINTGGGGGGTGTGQDRADMDDAQEGIETTQTILTAMIDGGDTEALNTEVETSTPPEALQVYNELMSESPNLSETVVESTIEKENVLPNAMVRDVMVANPHTAKSMVLMEKLDERFDPMPEYMKAQILAGQNIQTLKEELEAELGGYQLKKAIAMENILRYYQEELEPQAASDSIVALYQADNTLSSSYRLVWLYLERGEYQIGESVLNNIPAQYTLDEEEQMEYNEISAIYDMLAGLYENGNTIDSLTENQLNELQTLEAEGTLTAQAYARNILLALDEIEYDEPVLFPDFTKSSKAIEEYGKLINTKPPQMLEVYPNPSSGYVIISYNLETEADCSIEIKDVTGRTVQTLITTGKQDQSTVVTENWKTGLYVVTLLIDGKSKESVKFTLMK
jgi:hypothetical protein